MRRIAIALGALACASSPASAQIRVESGKLVPVDHVVMLNYVAGVFERTQDRPETWFNFVLGGDVHGLAYTVGSHCNQVNIGRCDVGATRYPSGELYLHLNGELMINPAGLRAYRSSRLLDGRTDVPEPATWALMIGGLGFVGVAVRRRRSGSNAYA